MPLYENVAKKRKLICVKRVKRWVDPGSQVYLDVSDVRNLGGNAGFMRLVSNDDKIKKVTKSVNEIESDTSDKNQETIDKKDLKDSLEGMTKARIVEIGEELLEIDLKSNDKKAKLIKNVLKAAKGKYRYVIENS